MTTFAVEKIIDLEILENLREGAIEKVKFFENIKSKTRYEKNQIDRYEEYIRVIEEQMVVIKKYRHSVLTRR